MQMVTYIPCRTSIEKSKTIVGHWTVNRVIGADGAVAQWQEVQSESCRPGFDPRYRIEGAAEPGAQLGA